MKRFVCLEVLAAVLVNRLFCSSLTFVFCLLAFSAPFSVAGTYSGGTGELNTPYLIGSAEDIIEMSNDPNNWDKHFLMIADVNMIGYTFATAVIAPDTSKDSGFQGSGFRGLFDGDNHIILNLTIDTKSTTNDYLGLFGLIGGKTEVKNLGLENIFVTGGFSSWGRGGLCGYNDSGTISNCYATGYIFTWDECDNVIIGGLCGYNDSFGTINMSYTTVTVVGGDQIGGLCGLNIRGTISNCYSTGDVTGGYSSGCLGGLCGSNEYGTISDCYSTGDVTGGDSSVWLGGLCGRNLNGIISYCYSTGDVAGGDSSHYLGGLCGSNDYIPISDCYSTGDVTGGDFSVCLGGLCGSNDLGTIRNSYTTGCVSAGNSSEKLGGFCGTNWSGTISNCFWDTDTSGWETSAGGTGLSTEDMQKMVTFTNATWDFAGESSNGTNDIWRMCEDGIDYPHLFYQYNVNGDFACPDGVGIDDVLSLSSNWLNSEEMDPGFNYPCDPTFDGVSNLADYVILAEVAGRKLRG